MSEEQLKAFIEKVKSDTSLQEKLKAAAADNAFDANAVAAIAKEAGFSISAEGINKMIKKDIAPAGSAEELSDEVLKGVAGGLSFDLNRFAEKSVPDAYSWLNGKTGGRI